jgi:hypothetical protein
MAVGGIRISHMSHLKGDMTMALTATQKKRATVTIKRLADVPKPAADAAVDPVPPPAPREPDGLADLLAEPVGKYWRIVRQNGEQVRNYTDDLHGWADALIETAGRCNPKQAAAMHAAYRDQLSEIYGRGDDEEKATVLAIGDAIGKAKGGE